VRRLKVILVLAVAVFLRTASRGQSVSNEWLRRGLVNLDTQQTLSGKSKLQLLYGWKKEADSMRSPQDSSYARLLHKIGVYEFYVTRRYNEALFVTLQALRINASGKPEASPVSAVTDLYNIAIYCDYLTLHKKALIYYDSAILFARRYSDVDNVISDSWLQKAVIYFRMGDYEKAVEEADRARASALQQRDSVQYMKALNRRAQALYFQGKLSVAQEDVGTAIVLARLLHEDFELASALKSRALILTDLRDYTGVQASFKECIAARMRTKKLWQVAGDYNDWGIFYGDTLRDYQKAANCYALAIRYAGEDGDSNRMALASVNLGENYYHQGELTRAMTCYSQAMDYLKIGKRNDPTANPTAAELAALGNKAMIQVLFNSKTQLLLALYRKTEDRKWLTACLATALLNDSLMREIRHEQLGEQSKLYWRDKTRGFFANALEACYLLHDDRLAFYFMEESRSVLLQDKLNELGANAHLPPAEAAEEERLQIRVFELQQKPGELADTSLEGRAVLRELLTAKESLEQYIRRLEREYPVYYQYKYADGVQPLSSLQTFLATNNQSFVEYFIQDTLCFALGVRPSGSHLVRIVRDKPGIEEQLARFVRLCSDENALNRDFPEFLANANGLYRRLMEPFRLPGGRVIICQDNELVPFEALSRDPAKADFLVKDFAFSYVYSARWLMSRHEQRVGTGDFLGIAPVQFGAYQGLADLPLSEEALRSCSAPYGRSKLLLRREASRENFIRQVCDYHVTTILTHARADSADEEPVLFMNDSVIRLSELQMLSRPAVRLIVLSACQTNVGKNRSGEGIFSLARGFSAAGIPAVAATQWMADEGAIYTISRKFNEYIYQGMNKDEALQKAKLFYLFEDRKGSLLPCYWADMVLIGNTEPVAFSPRKGMGWVVEALVSVVLLGGFGLYWVWKRRRIA